MNTKRIVDYVEDLFTQHGIIMDIVERRLLAERIVKYISVRFYNSKPKEL